MNKTPSYNLLGIGETRQLIADNQAELCRSFESSANLLLSKYQELKNGGSKGDLKYVYICYLRSGISTKLPLYRIDMYDERHYRDLAECNIEWDVSIITNRIYSDIPMPEANSSIIGNQVKPFEIEDFWYQEAEKYFTSMRDFIGEITRSLRSEIPKSIEWYYGEFWDKCSRIG